MKDKDIIEGEELEGINNELFASFDPKDESWMIGGSKTVSSSATGDPRTGLDAMIDYDINFAEIEDAS